MSVRIIITAAVALLALAAPAAAQERGTIEFGAFANRAFYDDVLNMEDGWGWGGRVGAFITPRFSAEFDIGFRKADRTLGLQEVKVEALAARLVAVPLQFGRVSVLAGGGLIHTDYQGDETDGLQAMLGLKLGLSPAIALRLEGLADFNRNDTRNQSLQLGMSYYRHPAAAPPPAAAMPMMTHDRPDSVSAAETARLRAIAAQYVLLRDSLGRIQPTEAAPSASALATLRDIIYFQHDQSSLSAEAKATLDNKIPLFRANPAMRIVIIGHASAPGSDSYNAVLGLRRANSAKAYLVAGGVQPGRIEVATHGEEEPAIAGSGERADAANRRATFRLQVAEARLVPGGR